MGRKALEPGESTAIGAKAKVTEIAVLDRYGRPSSRTETVWTANARRRAVGSGQVERRSAIGATKLQAEARLRVALKHDAKKPSTVEHASVTVEDFAGQWLSMKTVEAKLASTSLSAYRNIIRLHIVPGLGGFRIEQITTRAVKAWITELHSVSPANAKRARSILGGMLELAEESGAVERNVLAGMKLRLSQKPRVEARIVQADQIGAMLERADAHRYNRGRLGKYMRIQLGSGARIGEVLALRRRDFTSATADAPARILIDGTLIAPDHGPVFRRPSPKVATARRRIPVTSYAAEAIEQLLADLDADGLTGPDELLFQTVHGTPVASGNIRRTWRTVRGDLPGLEDLKPHALRATMTSALVYSVGPDKAARQIGHVGTGTIFKHYLHRRTFVDDVDLGSMELDPRPEPPQALSS